MHAVTFNGQEQSQPTIPVVSSLCRLGLFFSFRPGGQKIVVRVHSYNIPLPTCCYWKHSDPVPLSLFSILPPGNNDIKLTTNAYICILRASWHSPQQGKPLLRGDEIIHSIVSGKGYSIDIFCYINVVWICFVSLFPPAALLLPAIKPVVFFLFHFSLCFVLCQLATKHFDWLESHF